jgi:hypothetical protein
VKYTVLLVLALVLAGCNSPLEFQTSALGFDNIDLQLGADHQSLYIGCTVMRVRPKYIQTDAGSIVFSLAHGLQIFHLEDFYPPFPKWGELPAPGNPQLGQEAFFIQAVGRSHTIDDTAH